MARDGKKIAQEIAKRNADNLKALKQEEALQQNISAILTQRVQGQKKLNKDQKDLLSDIQGEKDISAKLTKIQEAKQKILERQAKTGTDIGKKLLEQLDTLEFYVEAEKERKDLAQEYKDLTKDAKDELFTSLGTMGDMLKAGTALGAAMALFKGLVEGIGKGFENTIGFASDLNKELGITSAQAVTLGMQNLSVDAMFSRFSIEQLNQATTDLATTFGTTAGISNDLRNTVAELSSMGVGGDDAAKLSQMFETANGSSQDMAKEIKNMANDAGVMASTTFKDLASQQRLMLGATKAEIKLLAKKTIELNKQGLTLDTMKSISENMMDIEGTMKAQAKARTLLAGKLSKEQLAGMQGMTAAAMEFQQTGNFEALREQLKKAGMDAAEFNKLGPRGQQLYAESIGMTADQLAEQIQKQEQADKAASAGMIEKAGQGVLEIYQKIPGGIKEATTGLIAFIAQMSIMNMMQGKGTGLSNLIPGMGKKGGGGDIQTEVPGADDVAPQAQGSEGGLKSLAEGLKAMGDGKVFAGIGAVALAGPAFVIALPSIPFLLFMGKVKLNQIEENFSGLASGLAEMSFTFMGSAAVAAFAIAAIPSIASIPFLLFMGLTSLGQLVPNFTNLSLGLNAMASTLMGSLALAAFAIAAIPSIASIPFLLFFGLTPLAQLAPNFISLAVGLNAMASTFMGSLALAAFAVAAGLGIASIPFLIAISLLGIPASVGLGALGVGLTALGTAAASGLPFLGIALIGALGLAMIPFAIALNIATPAIEAFGGVIVGVMGAIPPIISAIAEGFVTMMSALSLENIGALMLLGPALLLASVGMIAFSAAMLVGGLGSFFGGGIIDDISELAMIGPQLGMAGEGLAKITTNLSEVSGVIETLSESLNTMGSVTAPLYAVAGGLFSIAGGLISMAGAGLLALPIFAALGGLAAIAPTLGSLGSLFGGGDDEASNSSDSDDSDMIDYDRLASALQSQPIILTIDGKAVQKITAVQRRQGKNARSFS